MRFKKAEWLDFLSQINWWPTFALISVHLGAIYGFYLSITSGKWQTVIFGYILGVCSAIGTLTGSHRYFSHKSFKAKWQLKLILCIFQTLSGQKSIIEWARDHRTHHKYTGTDADVANINRGFFFAHMGWLMMKPHPECEAKLKECNLDDLWADPMIKFQYDYYIPLLLLINVLIPTFLPYYLFDESLCVGFFGTFLMRYIYTLHISFCGNSVAHVWGTKPYDKTISATHNESLIYMTMGGAYHNYHHVFPYDYSASEFGCDSNFNFNTSFINFFARIGWAYHLRKAPKEIIALRKTRTGDSRDCTNSLRRYPILDWICGMSISASILWLLFGLRAIYQYFSVV